MRPIKIELQDNKLHFKWNDDLFTCISLADLRRKCPCAECMAEKENFSDSYIPLYSDEEVTVEKIEKVGHYAISLVWKDGHSTGVYEFSHLAKLTGLNKGL